jgi:hypothetical protein
MHCSACREIVVFVHLTPIEAAAVKRWLDEKETPTLVEGLAPVPESHDDLMRPGK